MTRWQPYPEYKDSGVEWLGEIPAHWDIRKLKHISSVSFSNVDKHTKEEEQPVHLCNYVDVYYNDYITADLEFMKATASPGEIRRFTLKETDIIITKDSETWDDIAVPAYVPSSLEGILCGYHLALIRPNVEVVDGEYLFRSFLAPGINDQFKVAATGITRYGLGKYWLDNSLFLVPPPAEQRAIAAFLDRQTARLDALVAEQRRLSELLRERRAALISHAVTRGVPGATHFQSASHLKMKDTGIPWLGEVPAHWEVISLKFAAKRESDAIKTGPFGSQLLSSEMMEGDIKVYNQRNVIDRDLAQGDNYISRKKYEELQAFTVYPGDVLVTTRGTIGRCVVVPDDAELGILHPCLMRIQPDPERLSNEFLILLIQDSFLVQGQLFEMSNATTIDVIYSGTMQQVRIPLPPLPEQRAIAAYLDRETAKIDAAVAEIETAIACLEEYRTALVSAAVTGKIDVRCNALLKCVAREEPSYARQQF